MWGPNAILGSVGILLMLKVTKSKDILFTLFVRKKSKKSNLQEDSLR